MGARAALLTLIPLLLTIHRPKIENNLKTQAILLTIIGLTAIKAQTSISCLSNRHLVSLKDCGPEGVEMAFDRSKGFPMGKPEDCSKHEENRCYLLKFKSSYNFSSVTLRATHPNLEFFRVKVIDKEGTAQKWSKGTGPWNIMMIDSINVTVLCYVKLCVYDDLKSLDQSQVGQTTEKAVVKKSTYDNMLGTVPTIFGFCLFCVFLYTMKHISKKRGDSSTRYTNTRTRGDKLDFMNIATSSTPHKKDTATIITAYTSGPNKGKTRDLKRKRFTGPNNEGNRIDTTDTGVKLGDIDGEFSAGPNKKKKVQKTIADNLEKDWKKLEYKTAEEIAEEFKKQGLID